MSNKTLAALLLEAELYQYYESFCNTLKVTTVEQLKYVQEEDLQGIGFSKPEIRRLQKYQQKHQKHPYLKKLKKLAYLPVHKHYKNTCELPTVQSSTNFISSYDGSKHIISANQISIQKQLGSGEFGTVQQGIWSNGNERIQVAVKCLNKANVQTNPMEFLKEAAIMHAIEHENIVRLYGVVLDTDSSLWLVTELAPLRSLLECLKDSELRTTLLNVSTLCDYILQICNGMVYLEGKRLIHRDLAARNILVFSKTRVKISDFGLSRALNVGKTYYQTNFNVNLKLPIAWSSPESINFLRFTTASDVWSFGVCVWEIFSYGFQPWAGMTGQQILEAIDEPQFSRLEQPECCPRDYYDLMLRCWEHVPSKRPTFYEICRILPKITPNRVMTLKGKSDSSNEMLNYRCNEHITVLDSTTFSPFWKGITDSGKTGLFDPTYCGAVNDGDCEQVTNKKKSKLPYLFGVYSSNTLESNKTKRDGLSSDQEQLIPLTPTSIQNPSFDQESLVSDCAAKCAHEYYEIYPSLGNWNSLKKNPNADQSKCVFNNDCGLDFVKTISLKDEKILEQAIEIANKINSKSISNTLRLTNDISGRKKSGLKLISKVNNHNFDCSNPSSHSDTNSINVLDHRHDVKTFTDELKKSPDLQSTITAESREAYNNLVDNPAQCSSQLSTLKLPNQRQCNNYDLSDLFKNNLGLNDIRNMNLDKPENSNSGNENHGHVSSLRGCDCDSLYNVDDMRPIVMNNGCSSLSNTLPLPPRPKKLPTVTKRHVRIHPLKMTNKSMNDHDFEAQKYLEVKGDNDSPTEFNYDGSNKDRMNHFALFKINNPITESEEERCTFTSYETAKSPKL